MTRMMGQLRPLAAGAAMCLMLAACGGDNVGKSSASNSASASSYTVSGTVSGLPAGASLVLENNGGGPVTVSASGAFSFATAVAAGSAYAVTVVSQPAWWNCTVSQGSGTSSVNVTNVGVSCAVDKTSPTSLVSAAAFGSARNASGTSDGTKLVGVAVDGSGNVYASDNNFGDVFGIPTGSAAPQFIYTAAGSAGLMTYSATNSTLYEADGGDDYIVELPNPLSASVTASYLAATGLTHPNSAAVDSSGNVYVVDTGTSPATVTEYTSSGTKVATLASGTSTFTPYAVAVDSNKNVYVTDQTHNEVFKIVSGTPTVLAGSGSAADTDGTATAASFNAPGAITVDASNNLYVVDSGSGALRQIIPSSGVVTTLSTVTGATAIAVGSNENLYVTAEGTSAGVFQLAPTAQ
jgi:hypothetical protein